MIKTQLKPCENLLYNWIQLRSSPNHHFHFDVYNFKAWTGEFLEKSASLNEINAALFQLNQMGLITINGTEIQFKNYLKSGQVKRSKFSNIFRIKYKNYHRIFWGILIPVSLMMLWFSSLMFSPLSHQGESQLTFPSNPYQVLAEKD